LRRFGPLAGCTWLAFGGRPRRAGWGPRPARAAIALSIRLASCLSCATTLSMSILSFLYCDIRSSSSSRQSYHSHSLTAGSGSMPSCSAKAAITYTISRAHTLALEPSTVPAAKTLTCRKDVASCIPSEINLPCGAQIFHPTSEPTGQSEVRTEYPGSARRETQVSAFSLHGHRRFPQATWKNRRHTKTEIDDLSV